jgi:hypothetical protein
MIIKKGDFTGYGVVTMVAHWGFIAVSKDGKVTVKTNPDWDDWYKQGR